MYNNILNRREMKQALKITMVVINHIRLVQRKLCGNQHMYQVVVENLWLDSTKKVPSIVAAFCVGMVEDVDASGHVYSLNRTRIKNTQM
jgi:hypothetical protein